MGPDGNNNLLNNLMYRNVQQSSESQSETSSSAESDWSDVNSIALQLGLHPRNVCVERFKVDRQKLENMIKSSSITEGMNAAEFFFDNIAKQSGARISWPSRLKIGAKTKKDPHVRIVGKNPDVLKAKEQVLNFLDSRGCRVIMKMDISFTDHSYIIGRGGNNIKKIMEDTLTHIHFPDSNRSSQTEKSNQVSLCGSLEGVEKARALVRLSTPLIISYELPMSIPGRPMPDSSTEYVKEAENTYNVQVKFVSRAKLHVSVLVKGCEQEADKVQDAARFLCFHMCGSSQIQVILQLRISPQHHEIVKGSNNEDLLKIMEHTNTKIIFPDLSDVNIKSIEKSQVIITGMIDGVYMARQQLIGKLPVALIFDYPEDSVDQEGITAIMNQLGVLITARRKQRQSTLCFVIKGIEKYVDKIYEARHQLLRLYPEPIVKAKIPAAYFSSCEQDFNSSALVEILSSVPNSPLTPGGLVQGFTPIAANAAISNQIANLVQNFSNLTPANLRLHALQQQPFRQVVSQASSSNSVLVSPRSMNPNSSGYMTQLSQIGCLNDTDNSNEQLSSNGISNFQQPQNQMINSTNNVSRRFNPGDMNQFEVENRLLTPIYHSSRAVEFERKRIEGLKAMDCFDLSKEQVRTPTDAWSKFSLSKSSPFALESTPVGVSQWAHREKLIFDKVATTGLIDSVPWSDRIPLSQFKDIHSLLSHLKLEHYISNFVVEKIDMKAFVTLTGEDLRELKINAFGARKRLLLAINQLKAEGRSSLSSDNVCEYIHLSDFKDIPSLFTHLEMEHHIENFVQNEIDLKTFVTLTSHDLVELGVKPFIERKRLLLAINQLKSEKFVGSAAPGAERRSSGGIISEQLLFEMH